MIVTRKISNTDIELGIADLSTMSCIGFASAEGDADDDTGEAETIEPSGDDMPELSASEQYLAPKLRELIRKKKSELKVKYGKAKLFKRGWRFRWKTFKKNGGKAELKMEAKGLVINPASGKFEVKPAPSKPVTPKAPISQSNTGTSTDNTGASTAKTSGGSKVIAYTIGIIAIVGLFTGSVLLIMKMKKNSKK